MRSVCVFELCENRFSRREKKTFNKFFDTSTQFMATKFEDSFLFTFCVYLCDDEPTHFIKFFWEKYSSGKHTSRARDAHHFGVMWNTTCYLLYAHICEVFFNGNFQSGFSIFQFSAYKTTQTDKDFNGKTIFFFFHFVVLEKNVCQLFSIDVVLCERFIFRHQQRFSVWIWSILHTSPWWHAGCVTLYHTPSRGFVIRQSKRWTNR